MARALVVHASRHGATAGIAERIAEVLRAEGLDTVVARAADMPDPEPFDACLVGAGVYMGSWVKDGTAYLDRYLTALAGRPVWLFSSGPLEGSTKQSKRPAVDPIEEALGPAEGPGSGGRKRIEGLALEIRAREHRVFGGAYDPGSAPQSLPERVIRMLPGSKGILPSGDFRDWPAIEAWAREVAAEVRAGVPVG
jgi:menaquinone-dependent protoporphyrinogen oxidase